MTFDQVVGLVTCVVCGGVQLVCGTVLLVKQPRMALTYLLAGAVIGTLSSHIILSSQITPQ